MVRDDDGRTWLPATESAKRHRIRRETISVWAHRGKIASIRTAGRLYVCDDDVADAELAWRERTDARQSALPPPRTKSATASGTR